MGGHETYEAPKPADSKHEAVFTNLTVYGKDSKDFAHSAKDLQAKTDGLVDKGVLPPVDLVGYEGAFRTGKEVNAQDIKDAGIKCTKETGKDGSHSTRVEYPNGVTVDVADKKTVTGPNGNKVELDGTSHFEISPPNKFDKHGNVVDAKGNVIAKQNEDGTVSVRVGEKFYTQYPDQIRKEVGIIDGKSFNIIDTDTPLGGMRPPEVPPEKKRN